MQVAVDELIGGWHYKATFASFYVARGCWNLAPSEWWAIRTEPDFE
jgi:hypothetical protein